MTNRSNRNLWILLGVVCLLLPGGAAAQEGAPLPILWVSFVAAEEGKSTELTGHMISEGKELYEGLIADGHALNWGIAQGINHFPGDDWTHVEWVNFTSWEAVGEFVNRFMAGMQAKSPEQMAAEAAKWQELTVHGSHYDQISRHLDFSTGDGSRPMYINLAYLKAKEEHQDEMVGLYKDWSGTAMSDAQAAGKIIGYGIFAQEIHGDHSWSHVIWYTMPSLSGRDAVRKGMAARSEENRAALMAKADEVFEDDTHSDRILVVTHYAGAVAQE